MARTLHPDAVALGALPLAIPVVDVALEFPHWGAAFLAGHRFNGRITFREIVRQMIEKSTVIADVARSGHPSERREDLDSSEETRRFDDRADRSTQSNCDLL